jgi:hypothetical protein
MYLVERGTTYCHPAQHINPTEGVRTQKKPYLKEQNWNENGSVNPKD